jgi:hypothetical protein
MSKSYTSSPPSSFVACSGTVLEKLESVIGFNAVQSQICIYIEVIITVLNVIEVYPYVHIIMIEVRIHIRLPLTALPWQRL